MNCLCRPAVFVVSVWLLFRLSLAIGAAPIIDQRKEESAFQNAPRVVVQVESSKDEEQREARAATRENVIAWGTVILAGVTLLLWLATAKLANGASQSATKQLAVADESAKAMTEVAEATRNNAALLSGMLAKQMRAFLSVSIAGARQQAGAIRFEGGVSIENVGLTPARNVSYWIVARVMNPANPDLTKPVNVAIHQNDMTLNPRSSFKLAGIVDDLFSEEAIQEICSGITRRLFVWGEVMYEDEYGGNRVSKFCHTYVFFYAEASEVPQYQSYIHNTHNSST